MRKRRGGGIGKGRKEIGDEESYRGI